MRIQLLSPLLANQIAAGEVVERPASVVKELLENSLDAGATHIDIDIEKGGIQLIRIRDNGNGIHADDLPLALARHATSKVQQLADLEKLMSLGFRGEALASISAVSRLLLSSKTAIQDTAYSVRAEGRDREIKIAPTAHPVGTTVEIQDLFFNTPARRKFLRSEKTEFDHIETIVRRVLLARFDAGIKLQHNQKILLQLRPCLDENSRNQRINKICGSVFSNHAISFDIATASLRLWGWVVPPNVLRLPADLHYFYVNGRIVRDKLINHAIRQVYEQQFQQDSQMAYVLYLELPPQMVDVNVHPTKHEVRFRESRMVHDFIVTSLLQAFTKSDVNETTVAKNDELQLEHQYINYTQPAVPADIPRGGIQTKKPFPLRTAGMADAQQPHPQIIRETMTHYAVLAGGVEQPKAIPHKTVVAPASIGFALAQLHDQYILAQNEQGLVIIDRFAAQIKIIYGQLLTLLQQGEIPTQPLLMPVTLTLSADLIAILEKHTNRLLSLSIEATVVGPNTCMVRRLPTLLRGAIIANLLPAVLQQLKQETTDETLLTVIASHGISREAKVLTLIEMNDLLENFQVYHHLEHLPPIHVYKQIKLSDILPRE